MKRPQAQRPNQAQHPNQAQQQNPPNVIRRLIQTFKSWLFKPRILLSLIFTLLVFAILVITVFIVMTLLAIGLHFGWLQPEHGPSVFVPILTFGIAAIITGTLVATLISGIPIRPINKLVSSMDKLAEGDYSTQIDLGKSKIGQRVSKSFNALANELSQTEMLRSDFVNNISHEYKTPMVSISGFAKLIRKGNLTKEKENEYLDIIIDEINRLSSLSTNILYLTKVENQKILTDIDYFNLSEQIRSSILLLEEKWTRKNLEFDLEFPEITVLANEEMLKQVWINLIDNAIKFSPTDSVIHIKIQQDNAHTLTQITNHGDPIPPEDLQRIYGKFWQGDSSRAKEGSGIGLSIVKSIVTLHAGEVRVSSDEQATIFSVQIPLNPTPNKYPYDSARV
ncbi:sensor histidine kinase [Fundicoccus culcitae]|uniref:Heme sensor protein HssS n=1 Tax=Fundicoccus culcitae TaxID=2969821 RepID=A0ABY5PA33_9LACT|nr:HAMP domain-containing sensor histidine kinase [Fundicoccus culcitae]UUX35345.1 HAMP domain-containing histidine kinase [Fundicoccus culcitae]